VRALPVRVPVDAGWTIPMPWTSGASRAPHPPQPARGLRTKRRERRGDVQVLRSFAACSGPGIVS
jgi:hypothetical protein